MPSEGFHDIKRAAKSLEPQVILCGEQMSSIIKANVTIMIPLYKHGDIPLLVRRATGYPLAPCEIELKPGRVLVFGSEVDLYMKGPGQVVCFLLQWTEPISSIKTGA